MLQRRTILWSSPSSSLLPFILLPPHCSHDFPRQLPAGPSSLLEYRQAAKPCPRQVLQRCWPLPDPCLPCPWASRVPWPPSVRSPRSDSGPPRPLLPQFPSASKDTPDALTLPRLARPHLPGGHGTCHPGHGNSWREREGKKSGPEAPQHPGSPVRTAATPRPTVPVPVPVPDPLPTENGAVTRFSAAPPRPHRAATQQCRLAFPLSQSPRELRLRLDPSLNCPSP